MRATLARVLVAIAVRIWPPCEEPTEFGAAYDALRGEREEVERVSTKARIAEAGRGFLQRLSRPAPLSNYEQARIRALDQHRKGVAL